MSTDAAGIAGDAPKSIGLRTYMIAGMAVVAIGASVVALRIASASGSVSNDGAATTLAVVAGGEHVGHADHAAMTAGQAVDGHDLAALNEHLRTAWGIEVQGLRLTASGTMLDYRYRVVDAEAAASLHGVHLQPTLVHESSGMSLSVPFASKIGSLRQSGHAPIEGRSYVILFGNPGHLVKSGDRVDLQVADLRVNGLTIQ